MKQDEIIEMPEYLNASYEGDDLYTGDQVRELMKLVAEREREACADIAENWNSNGFPRVGVAEQIRARGEA